MWSKHVKAKNIGDGIKKKLNIINYLVSGDFSFFISSVKFHILHRLFQTFFISPHDAIVIFHDFLVNLIPTILIIIIINNFFFLVVLFRISGRSINDTFSILFDYYGNLSIYKNFIFHHNSIRNCLMVHDVDLCCVEDDSVNTLKRCLKCLTRE